MENCTENQLEFSVFILYKLAESWNKNPYEVYDLLNQSCILDDYIIKHYDCLHTLGSEYLIEDITELAREKGVKI